jgi:hypothetical protein
MRFLIGGPFIRGEKAGVLLRFLSVSIQRRREGSRIRAIQLPGPIERAAASAQFAHWERCHDLIGAKEGPAL